MFKKMLTSNINKTAGGVYVACRVSTATEKKLRNYCLQNHITPVDEFHCTLIYDKHTSLSHVDIDINRIYNPPIKVKPKDQKLGSLGPNGNDFPVILLDSKQIKLRHDLLTNRYRFKSDYPKFIAHLTLSYTSKVSNIAKLPPIDFDIIFIGEYTEKLSD